MLLTTGISRGSSFTSVLFACLFTIPCVLRPLPAMLCASSAQAGTSSRGVIWYLWGRCRAPAAGVVCATGLGRWPSRSLQPGPCSSASRPGCSAGPGAIRRHQHPLWQPGSLARCGHNTAHPLMLAIIWLHAVRLTMDCAGRRQFGTRSAATSYFRLQRPLGLVSCPAWQLSGQGVCQAGHAPCSCTWRATEADRVGAGGAGGSCAAGQWVQAAGGAQLAEAAPGSAGQPITQQDRRTLALHKYKLKRKVRATRAPCPSTSSSAEPAASAWPCIPAASPIKHRFIALCLCTTQCG